MVIRVDILTNFCFFNVIGRPFEVQRILFIHFVGHKQTKILVNLVGKVKPQLKSYHRRGPNSFLIEPKLIFGTSDGRPVILKKTKFSQNVDAAHQYKL